MEVGEMQIFIKVWLCVFIALSYCYIVGKVTSEGCVRLVSMIPAVALFFLLPLNLTSVHLSGLTGFFIGWLCNFKLLLFAFGKGPLSIELSQSLPRFVAVACLPIKVHQRRTCYSRSDDRNRRSKQEPDKQITNRESLETRKEDKFRLNYGVKVLVLAILGYVYTYSNYMSLKALWVVYCLHIYLILEVVLGMVATVARTLLSLELEPQFNEPYLSCSLQDFWGRRWNLMVTSILRPTVYEPVFQSGTCIFGRRCAQLLAVLATFLVSGVMHELLFYYLGRKYPTWEVMRFFVLHGVCVVVEVQLKMAVNGMWQLPRLLGIVLSVGFVVVTAVWMFFPPLIFGCKVDERAFKEYAAVGELIKNVGRFVMSSLHIWHAQTI